MKRCQKMKQRRRARLSSMGRKRGTMQCHGDVNWRRRDTEEVKGWR
jgi:hypothetical protein